MKHLITLLLSLVLIAPLPSYSLILDETVTTRVYTKNSKATVMVSSLLEEKRGKFTYANGAGVILTPTGQVVTALHVVNDSKGILISFENGESYTARIVRTDRLNDLALLQIESNQDFPFVKIADFMKLTIGQNIYIIGNPKNFDFSLCVGVLSAIRRSSFLNGNYVLQTDASVNTGNSGGPAFDSQGDLIGIVSYMCGDRSGLGFLIPCNAVTNLLENRI